MADDTTSPDVTALQAQLDAANKQVADSQKALDAANKQLKAANQKVADLTAQVGAQKGTIGDQAEEIEELQDQLKKAGEGAIDKALVKFDGSVRDAMEHYRKQYAFDGDRCIILKE